MSKIPVKAVLFTDRSSRAAAFRSNRQEARAIPRLIAELNHGETSDRLREATECFLGESDHHDNWDGHDFAKALSVRLNSWFVGLPDMFLTVLKPYRHHGGLYGMTVTLALLDFIIWASFASEVGLDA